MRMLLALGAAEEAESPPEEEESEPPPQPAANSIAKADRSAVSLI